MEKKGAMELSIGTIVVIVLAMSMLILGMVLLKNIMEGTTEVADMGLDQVKDQVSKMYGENTPVVKYPKTGIIDVKGGEIGQFGFGIKNLLEGSNAGTKFSYEVVIADDDLQKKCGVSAREAEDWITIGRTGSNIDIAPGKTREMVVRIEVDDGASLCSFRYMVKVYSEDNKIYDSVDMDVTIRA